MYSENGNDRGETLREIKEKVNRALRRNADGIRGGRMAPGQDPGKPGSLWESFRRDPGKPGPLWNSIRRLTASGKGGPQKGQDGDDTGAGGTGSTAKSRREKRVSWTFLSLSLAGVLLFFVLPFMVVIYYSLIDNPVKHRFVGLSNYGKVLSNSAFRLAAANTLKFSAVSVPLAVGLALLLAVVMEKKIPWKSRIRSFFLSPLMVPTASVIMIWQILFHYNGLANVWLGRFGIDRIDWLKSSYAQVPIILLFIWKNLGYNMILFMAGLANIPRDQIEVARLESATEFQIFWLIKIRYLSSTILFVTIMSLINSFKVFREVYLMAGDYPYDALYMLQHFMNNTFRSLDYQKLSAAAVLMALFMIVVIGVLFVSEDRFGQDLE